MKRYLSACLVALVAGGVALPLPTMAQQANDTAMTLPQVERARLMSQVNGDTDLLTQKGWDGPLAKRDGKVSAVIQLYDTPSAGVYGDALQSGVSEGEATRDARASLARIEATQQRMLPQLASLNATTIYRVQRVYNGIAVQVDAASLTAIAQMPEVKAIHPLVPKYLEHSGSVPLIKAPSVWSGANGSEATGEGMSIGIIDTGIDYVHTDFGGNGNYSVVSDTTAPLFNDKVVGGYDFVGDAYNADPSDPNYNPVPVPDNNPLDCNGHGTHVAGTAAGYGVLPDGKTYTGPYNATTFNTKFRIAPGVAPGADLYALRVFGCDGSTNLTDAAIEWSVDPNGDGNFNDRLDVINMSLGSAYGSDYDSTAEAVETAVAAGVIVVASAGNSGDAYLVTGSPASANSSISVAATRQPDAVYDGFKTSVAIGGNTTHPARFSVNYPWSTSAPVSGQVVYLPGGNVGCAAFTPEQATQLVGKVLLIDWADGFCGSGARGANIVAAGGAGFIIADDSPVFDLLLAGSPVIPGISVSKEIGAALKATIAGGTALSVTFDYQLQGSVTVVDASLNDTLSDFSSRGPSRSYGLKPDIAAPGENIFSAATGTGNRGRSLNGTSMAAPHVAGAMALLREVHPTWTVAQLKALAMNTALTDVRNDDKTIVYDPARVGAGRIDLNAATKNSFIAYDASNPNGVSASFGLLELTEPVTLTKVIQVQNLGTTSKTFTASFVDATKTPGVTFSVTPSTVTMGTGRNAIKNVTVTMVVNPAELTNRRQPAAVQEDPLSSYFNDASGLVVLSDSSGIQLVRVPVHAIPVPVSEMRGVLDTPIEDATTALSSTITLTGTGLATTVIPTSTLSLVTAFELQGTSPRTVNFSTDTDYADLQAFGVSEGTWNGKNRLYFGVSTYGEWQTPSQVEIDIEFDTNRDGKTDYVLYTSNTGTSQDPTSVFVTKLVKFTAAGTVDRTFGTKTQDLINVVPPGAADTRLFGSNVMFLPVNTDDMGLTKGTAFNYTVYTYALVEDNDVFDVGDKAIYTYGKPGVSFTGALINGLPAFVDLPGEKIGVNLDPQAFANNESLGVLLLHHHNRFGSRVQTFELSSALKANVPGPIKIYMPIFYR